MLILFCIRGCGRIERPAFPAPSDLQKAGRSQKNSRETRGEIAKLRLKMPRRHCEERLVRRSSTSERRKRRSNPFFLYVARWIASRSLSSGAHSRDPLARNDGLK